LGDRLRSSEIVIEDKGTIVGDALWDADTASATIGIARALVLREARLRNGNPIAGTIGTKNTS